MSRSRSSFDLSGAIATAASLSVIAPEEAPVAHFRGMPLVSFGVVPPVPSGAPHGAAPSSLPRPPLPPPPPPEPEPVQAEAEPVAAEAIEPLAERLEPTVAALPPAEDAHGPADTVRRPPKLPDLSEIRDPVLRCLQIIDWIVEAVAASDVFIADAAGLPIAGAITELEAQAETRLAATGVVASAVAHLAAAIPGNSSALFEMHVGDGPFFQLIGFDVAAGSYVVGFHRATPLGFRQAHAVRLACRHALGPPGVTMGSFDGSSPKPRAEGEA
jgi:hypothetical protein